MSPDFQRRLDFALHQGLALPQAQVLAALADPAAIQDFVAALPVNYDDAGGLLSVQRALAANRAQCLEGAFIAAFALWMNGETPFIVILKAEDGEDHAIVPFLREGHWGAISKTNHVWLRYRDPVYCSLRELVMSYFHEYVSDYPADGARPPGTRKTLRAYTPMFDLSTLASERWVTGMGDCREVDVHLHASGHCPLLSARQEALLKERDDMERRAGAMRQFEPAPVPVTPAPGDSLEPSAPAEPRTLWLSGLPGSGKTTLAHLLQACFTQAGQPCQILDGDALRAGPHRDLGFSSADRRENIRRTAELARAHNAAGEWVIVALVSPAASDRDMARGIVGAQRFQLVWVNPPQAVCEQRDPKGLYARARAGGLPGFTGVGAPFEPLHDPDLVLDTHALSEAACTQALWRLVRHDAGSPESDPAAGDLESWLQTAIEQTRCTLDEIAAAMIEDGNAPAPAHVMAVLAALRYGKLPLNHFLDPHGECVSALHLLRQHLGEALRSVEPEPGSHPAGSAGLWNPSAEPRNRLALADRTVEVRVVCQSPRLAVIDGLLSGPECDRLMDAARDHLGADEVVYRTTGQAVQDTSMRSSRGAFLLGEDHAWLRPIHDRIAAVAGLPTSHLELLSISRYGLGQKFEPHHDYFAHIGKTPSPRTAPFGPEGDRVATVLVYLNAVEAGGMTTFPEVGLQVRPQRGSAVFFSYLRDDGSADPSSLHGGQPVIEGEKWIATFWFRRHAFVTEVPAVESVEAMAG